MNSIPAFLDSQHLTIRRAERTEKDGIRQELEAVDPQGDTLVLSKCTAGTGNTPTVGRSSLGVSYRQSGSAEPVEHKSIGTEEAYDLFRALNKAPKAEQGVDNKAFNLLMLNLRTQGGVAGGA